MEDRNVRIAAMQAKFQETIAKLREKLTTRLRVEEESNRIMREKEAAETKKRKLIVEELLFRLWVRCGHVG